MISLSYLLNSFVKDNQLPDIKLSGIASDSRMVKSGYLFLACRGASQDGLQFIEDAISRGAIAVAVDSGASFSHLTLSVPLIAIENLNRNLGFIAARFYGEPSKQLALIGITGTNGKTSCSHLIAQCLDDQHHCGIIGTMGNGFYNQLTATVNTTPGAVELQSTLKHLQNKGASYVAMEVSSHGLEQGRISGCEFSLAVFTNLTQDHLDYHGTMEAYGAAKLKLFAEKSLKAVVVNLDDEFSTQILDAVSSGVVTVGVTLQSGSGLKTQKYIHGNILERTLSGTRVAIDSSWGCAEFATHLLGEFNITNLLLVLAVELEIDVPFENAVQRLQALQAPKGRLESFVVSGKPLVIVDYAHTPDALEKVLQTLHAHTEGKLWVIFGCGGDRDSGKRPQMGAIAETYADHVCVTDDNPRSESSQKIIQDILAGVKNPAEIMIQTPREMAIEKVIASAAANDIVLVAGKGHEEYQIIGSQVFPFSDREIVARLLREAA